MYHILYNKSWVLEAVLRQLTIFSLWQVAILSFHQVARLVPTIIKEHFLSLHMLFLLIGALQSIILVRLKIECDSRIGLHIFNTT